MKNSTKLSIAAAALSGLLMGTAARASTSSIPVQSPAKKATMQKSTIYAGQKALKLELVERPECISKIIFENAIKLCVEKNIIQKKVNGEAEELFPGTENRALIQLYSKQISRFLRSPHFALQ